MPNKNDPLTEAFCIFIGPFAIVSTVIYLVFSVASCIKESKNTTYERQVIQKPLSYRAGKVTREVSSNFIKGFFSTKN